MGLVPTFYLKDKIGIISTVDMLVRRLAIYTDKKYNIKNTEEKEI